jgi:glycosyltransferase involved in cell wall biosynthesis
MTDRGILFISPYDPGDVSKWSGTIYFLFQALKNNSEGVPVRSVRGVFAAVLDFAARVLNRVVHAFGISFDCRFSMAYAMISGVYLTIRVFFAKGDTIVAVAASNYMPYVFTRKPVIYISDGTFRCVSELYSAFGAFPGWLRKQGERNEARSLSRARFVIYSSRWASESAQKHYGVKRGQLFELPFGPNIPPGLIEEHYVEKVIRSRDDIKLLFISADWQRKNGELVLNICQSLIAAGVKARLITIGDIPTHVEQLNFVDNRGFLHKSDRNQLSQICEAYRESHFFVLPTKADTFGVVFCEAQAFGVPSVTYDIGGTSSAVANDKTGVLLPVGSEADDFANAILKYIDHPELYYRLSSHCRNRYQNEANWHSWSTLILKLAESTPLCPVSDSGSNGSTQIKLDCSNEQFRRTPN